MIIYGSNVFRFLMINMCNMIPSIILNINSKYDYITNDKINQRILILKKNYTTRNVLQNVVKSRK